MLPTKASAATVGTCDPVSISHSQDEDKAHLEGIVLLGLRGTDFGILVLVFRNELHTILQRHVDKGRDAPQVVIRLVGGRVKLVVTNTRRDVIAEREIRFGEEPTAVEGRAGHDVIASPLITRE